jgi:hypothetical protein
MPTPLTEATCTEKLGVLWSLKPEEVLYAGGCANALSECTTAGKNKGKCLRDLSAAHDKFEELIKGGDYSIVGGVALKHAYLSPAKKIAILQKEKEIGGINFPEGARVYINENGKISGARLPIDTAILGVNCAKGEVMFHDNGRLEYATLATDQEIKGRKFPKGSGISFPEEELSSGEILIEINDVRDSEGLIQAEEISLDATKGAEPSKLFELSIFLPIEYEVDGHKFGPKTRITFDKCNRLSNAELVEPQEINGIKCDKDYKIGFYNGKTYFNAKLSEDQEVGGAKFNKGSIVMLDGDNKLQRAILGSDQEIGKQPFKKGATVNFDSDGNLESATLAKPQEINGIKCDKDYKIGFYNKTTYFNAKLSEDQEVGGAKFGAGSIIMLDGDNKLQRAILGSDQEIGKQPFKKGATVNFDADGKLESAILAEPQEINGVGCDKDYLMRFHQNGKLLSAKLSDPIPSIGDYVFLEGTQVEFDEDGNLALAEDWGPMYGADYSNSHYSKTRFKDGKVVEGPMFGRTYLNVALDSSLIPDRPDVTRFGFGMDTLLFDEVLISPKLFASVVNDEVKDKDGSQRAGLGGGAGLDAAFFMHRSNNAAILLGVSSSVEYTRYRDKLYNKRSEVGVPILGFVEPQVYGSNAYLGLVIGAGSYCNITDGVCDAMFQVGLKVGGRPNR